MDIFCVKCKKKTETTEQETVESTRGRQRLTGKCAECGSKKSQFVKKN